MATEWAWEKITNIYSINSKLEGLVKSGAFLFWAFKL